jgi:hypothetical protein
MSNANRKPFVRGRLVSQIIVDELPSVASRYAWERLIVCAVRSAWRVRRPGMPRPAAAHWLIERGAA